VEHSTARWRKSRRSSAAGPECVEIAFAGVDAAVRDTKNRAGGALAFDGERWVRFLDAAKDGEFDVS